MPSSATLGFSEHLPALLLAAGVALLSFLLLMNLRFKLHQRAASRHISPAFASGNRGAESLTAAFGSDFGQARRRGDAPRSADPATITDPVAVEAHQTLHRLMSELDTRSRTLEVLLRQADERIAQLEQALDERVGASISPTRTALSERSRKTPGEAAAVRSTGGSSDVESTPRPHVEVLMPTARPGYTPDPLTASIYELADRGRSPLEIARHLDEQVGKVELILALREV